jgi:hypothetical protein
MWVISVLTRAFEYVVFKHSFFQPPIGKLHPTYTVLNAVTPLSFVAGAISPVHLSVAMSFIRFVTAFVDVSTFPSELTEATFLIEFILTFICVAILDIDLFTPATFAMFHSVFEVSHIVGAVFPLVLSEPVRFAELVLTGVDVTVGKYVCALSRFQAVGPLAFISVSIFPLMNSVSVSFGGSPLTYIGVSEDTLPNALAFFEASPPFAFVDFPISPGVKSLSMRLIAHEFAFIFVAVGVAFHSTPVPGVTRPLPFVNSSLSVNHDSHSRAFTFSELTSVNSIVIFLKAKVLCLS